MKKNIELLINILEKSKISTLEVSSFWGFRKIKLSKNLISKNEETLNVKNKTLDNSIGKQICKTLHWRTNNKTLKVTHGGSNSTNHSTTNNVFKSFNAFS